MDCKSHHILPIFALSFALAFIFLFYTFEATDATPMNNLSLNQTRAISNGRRLVKSQFQNVRVKRAGNTPPPPKRKANPAKTKRTNDDKNVPAKKVAAKGKTGDKALKRSAKPKTAEEKKKEGKNGAKGGKSNSKRKAAKERMQKDGNIGKKKTKNKKKGNEDDSDDLDDNDEGPKKNKKGYTGKKKTKNKKKRNEDDSDDIDDIDDIDDNDDAPKKNKKGRRNGETESENGSLETKSDYDDDNNDDSDDEDEDRSRRKKADLLHESDIDLSSDPSSSEAVDISDVLRKNTNGPSTGFDPNGMYGTGYVANSITKQGKDPNDVAFNCHEFVHVCVAQQFEAAMNAYCRGTCEKLGVPKNAKKAQKKDG